MFSPVASLQFDPAPRAGEPLVSRRVPDYFLVSVGRVRGGRVLMWTSTVMRVDDGVWLIAYTLCILVQSEQIQNNRVDIER